MPAARALLLALGVVLVAALALVDSQPWSGPVLLTLTATHGVHAADLPVTGLAALSLALLARQARTATGALAG